VVANFTNVSEEGFELATDAREISLKRLRLDVVAHEDDKKT
jgi:hypothetical protein